jgi:hypothetical protein
MIAEDQIQQISDLERANIEVPFKLACRLFN